MNKILLSILLFACVISTLKAQIYTPSGTIQGGSGNNNVGIGTASPSSLLTLRSTGNDAVITLNRQGLWGSVASGLKLTTDDAGTDYWNFGMLPNGTNTLHLGRNGGSNVSFLTNGNVGIGTNNPISKLSVSGSITLASGLSNTSLRPSITSNTLINGEIRGYNGTNSVMDDGFVRFSAGGGTNGNVKSYIELSGYSTIPDMDRNIVIGTSGNEQLRIDRNGNLGIGTKSPDSKLTVNGTIHSTEVKVTQTVPADYVFEKYYLGESSLKPDYTLLTLPEIEKFTQTNHHLPNVPSAEEIKKNGLLLGEMSNILLQKIEELTLYSIEQQKKLDEQNRVIETQNNIVNNQQKQLETLAERLTRLEKK